MSADGIAFLQTVPIGRTREGEPVYVDQTWLLQLLALRDRTGGYAQNFIADAFARLNGVTEVYYQTTAPVGANDGDYWFDTDDSNAPYRLDESGTWVDASNDATVLAIQAAADAQATADGKVYVFSQTSAPTAFAVGDLWYDTDDAQRRTYRWSGSAWEDIADKTPYNIAAGFSGQGDLATEDLVTSVFFAAGVGNNALVDTGFRFAATYWPGRGGTAGASTDTAYLEAGLRKFKRVSTGTPSSNQYLNLNNRSDNTGSPVAAAWHLPINGGERIEASVYVGGANIQSSSLYVETYDAAGALVGNTSVDGGGASPGAGTGALGTFERLAGFFTTASTDRYVAIYCRIRSDGAGALTAIFACPMLRVASSGQTEFTPWTPGVEAELGADITSANVASAVLGQAAAATDGTIETGATKNKIARGHTAISNTPVTNSSTTDWVTGAEATLAGLLSDGEFQLNCYATLIRQVGGAANYPQWRCVSTDNADGDIVELVAPVTLTADSYDTRFMDNVTVTNSKSGTRKIKFQFRATNATQGSSFNGGDGRYLDAFYYR